MKHPMMFKVMIHWIKIMIIRRNQKIKLNIINQKNKMFNNNKSKELLLNKNQHNKKNKLSNKNLMFNPSNRINNNKLINKKKYNHKIKNK